jgi:apolipoprotein N-acyltransferase
MSELFSGRPLWLRLLIAAGAGAFGALGQAPYDLPVAMLFCLAAGFVLWRHVPEHCGSVGWAMGTGYFAFSTVWIIEPFQVDAARHGWMAPFALFFLSTGLALFWGAAFWLAGRLMLGSFGLVFTWTGAEMLRAYVLTGFPWASPAQVAIHGPISQMFAVVGPHGVTLILMLSAWLLSLPAKPSSGLSLRLGQAALLAAGYLALSLPDPRPPAKLTPHWVRLVQPNAAQHLKWQPDLAGRFFQRQLDLSTAAPLSAEQAPDLIVWPETAIPWRLETAQPVLDEIASVSGGAPVALGVLRSEGTRLKNALAVLTPQGEVSAVYDKHHLVPFGEYIPLAQWAERLGLTGLAATMGGFASGPGPEVLDFGSLGKALPLICYEAVFAHEVNAMPERADFLLQVTNDAWFGKYAGPQQHLAQARMRAIEQGLPLMRAANTGISAMIDPLGRVLAALPLGEAGFLDTALPAPLPRTLYSRTGDWPIAGIVLLAMLTGIRRRGRQRAGVSD